MRSLSGPVVTADEMRAAEAGCGIPLDLLMQRAGTALADAVWRFGGGAETLILCGPGNNGGDGYVAAAILRKRGVGVRVAASGMPVTDLARGAAKGWSGPVATLAEAVGAGVVVDALFGTGLMRPLSDDVTVPLRRLAKAADIVIAADLPSGLRSDDGADMGTVSADVTIAFGAAKPAHLLQPGASFCGTVLIADVGIQAMSNAQVLRRPDLRPPTARDHKYSRGMVAVVGGAMPGAAALAAIAALRSGAGYVAGVGLGVQGLPHAIVHSDIDVLDHDKLGAVVIGPGLGRDAAAMASLDRLILSPLPLVIDGDALSLVDAVAMHRKAPTILTPHSGEFDRLFGFSEASKIDRARDAAVRSGCTIVFKGSDTVVASPDGIVTIGRTGSAWLASAGTGDVLAGITGAMLARGMGAHEAACAAVWLHGEAARRAGPGLIADDLLNHLPACL